ncbi:hypothetical protein Tco_0821491 [Tanacetum coccineum]|uniref:Uncharacterized protein n=1 Tax=Tanacetum coccineum TaxID=301880 RepID=A0ABQ5AFD8_9ASTR
MIKVEVSTFHPGLSRTVKVKEVLGHQLINGHHADLPSGPKSLAKVEQHDRSVPWLLCLSRLVIRFGPFSRLASCLGGGEGDGVSNWTSSGVIGERSIKEDEVSLVDGVLEGALGCNRWKSSLEMEALVDAMDVDNG